MLQEWNSKKSANMLKFSKALVWDQIWVLLVNIKIVQMGSNLGEN